MQKFKLLVAFINLPRLIFHILLFYIYYDRCKDDVIINAKLKDGNSKIFSSFICLLTHNKAFRTLFYHRIGNYRYLICFLLPSQPTFYISKDSIIGKGFQCGHPFSTVINAEQIGDHCSIYQDVTIGVNEGGRPTIKNNVSIYVNSVVIGNIVVGNNVIVGAGTVLCKSVPDNCTVIGNPARIIKKDGVRVNIPL